MQTGLVFPYSVVYQQPINHYKNVRVEIALQMGVRERTSSPKTARPSIHLVIRRAMIAKTRGSCRLMDGVIALAWNDCVGLCLETFNFFIMVCKK